MLEKNENAIKNPIVKDPKYQNSKSPEDNEYYDEEMLVLYYVTSLIM